MSEDLVCFVIGPIGDKNAEPGSAERRRYELSIQTLENVIQPACYEAGLDKPLRADKISVAGEITEQTFRLIRDAEIVVADVTDGNPNVMYELGLRHTRNKLTLQVGERDHLPFDINVIRTIQFKRTEGGYIDAKNDLRKALESGISGRFDPVTATRLWNDLGLASPSESAALAPAGESGDLLVAGGDEESPGYLELWVDAEETMPRITTALEEILKATEEIGDLARKGTDEINDSDEAGGGSKGRLVVAIRFAERLDGPIAGLEEVAKQYRADVYSVDAAVDTMLAQVEKLEYEDDEAADIASGLSALSQLGRALEGALPSIQGFRESVTGISNMARPVRTRTKRLADVLDDIMETSSKFAAWGDRARGLLDSLDLPDIEPEPDDDAGADDAAKEP